MKKDYTCYFDLLTKEFLLENLTTLNSQNNSHVNNDGIIASDSNIEILSHVLKKERNIKIKECINNFYKIRKDLSEFIYGL